MVAEDLPVLGEGLNLLSKELRKDSMSVQQQQSDQDSSRAPTHPGAGGSGGTGTTASETSQAFTVSDPQRALTVNLMEQVCDPKNLLRAYRRARANKGSPGVDGMSVYQLADWLRQHQEALLASLRNGTYRPQLVRAVEIPKPGRSPHCWPVFCWTISTGNWNGEDIASAAVPTTATSTCIRWRRGGG